jgi:hypothetical protein
MKKILIFFNIVSLLSIFFAFINAINIVGVNGVMNIHIPINHSITIKTPLVVILTLIFDIFWLAKRC